MATLAKIHPQAQAKKRKTEARNGPGVVRKWPLVCRGVQETHHDPQFGPLVAKRPTNERGLGVVVGGGGLPASDPTRRRKGPHQQRCTRMGRVLVWPRRPAAVVRLGAAARQS
jgi:hypothetical protein